MMRTISMKGLLTAKRIGFLATGIALGALLGWSLTWHVMSAKLTDIYNQIRPIRDPDVSYPLINPLLSYEVPDGKQFKFDEKLQNTLQSFIDKKTNSGEAKDISTYYRDLPQGRWVGINENMTYNPASLIKVALVLAYYKQADENANILSRKITYTKALNNAITEVPFQTPSNLTVGQSYSIQDLIGDLMINSDNGAKNALLSGLDTRALAEVYSDLGLENPDRVADAYTISAKAYSLFFRILYNATYVSRSMSERALDLLIGAQYKDGIVAGVPANVKVAQKFGEHISVDADGNPTEYELHDCGIIYKTNNPYILCIMTRGGDLTKLTSIIQQISQIVYQQAQ